jgi:hypothetical protein
VLGRGDGCVPAWKLKLNIQHYTPHCPNFQSTIHNILPVSFGCSAKIARRSRIDLKWMEAQALASSTPGQTQNKQQHLHAEIDRRQPAGQVWLGSA